MPTVLGRGQPVDGLEKALVGFREEPPGLFPLTQGEGRFGQGGPPDGTISGLTEEYIRVDVESNANLTNTIVNVTIKEAFSEKCIGTIAEPNRIPAISIAI